MEIRLCDFGFCFMCRKESIPVNYKGMCENCWPKFLSIKINGYLESENRLCFIGPIP